MEHEVLQTYREAVQCQCPKLDKEALDYFMSKLTVSELTAKAFYIEANQPQTQIGYIAKGLMRIYCFDDKGNEINISFPSDKMPIGDFSNLDNPRPSRFYIQCLEKTTIINHPYSHLQDCVDKYPALERYFRLIYEQTLSRFYDRIQTFLLHSAEERYISFVNENPDLVQRISVSHLCSYLGIGRQALTKIRKRIITRG